MDMNDFDGAAQGCKREQPRDDFFIEVVEQGAVERRTLDVSKIVKFYDVQEGGCELLYGDELLYLQHEAGVIADSINANPDHDDVAVWQHEIVQARLASAEDMIAKVQRDAQDAIEQERARLQHALEQEQKALRNIVLDGMALTNEITQSALLTKLLVAYDNAHHKPNQNGERYPNRDQGLFSKLMYGNWDKLRVRHPQAAEKILLNQRLLVDADTFGRRIENLEEKIAHPNAGLSQAGVSGMRPHARRHILTNPEFSRQDNDALREKIMAYKREHGDPDHVVFTAKRGVFENRVGQVDPVTHQPLKNDRSPLAIGGIKKPWQI